MNASFSVYDHDLYGNLNSNGNAFISYHDMGDFSAIAKHFVDVNDAKELTRTIHFNAGKSSDENQIRRYSSYIRAP